MDAKFPELHKRSGVCYATTDDGYELPVIDVTHPAFATVPPGEALEALRRRNTREAKLRAYLPRLLRERMVRFMVERSSLLKAALDATPSAFMSGTATYLMKLGAENLGAAWARPLDRRLARTYPPLALRLRLGTIARLLADGLAKALETRPASRVELLNLGGGPAMDSLNALILLRREHPSLLAGRSFRIHVLDRDASGPRFGARALDALKASGPLGGLDLSLTHVPFDWNDVAPLEELLARQSEDTLVAASSEGALFDYASPETVLKNLQVLHGATPPDFFLAGDHVLDDEGNRIEKRETRLALQLYSPPTFEALVMRAGFRIAAKVDGGSTCFRLEKRS